MKTVRRAILAGLCCGVVYVVQALGAWADATIGRAEQLEVSGKFQEAADVLKAALDMPGTDASGRKELEFELDRLERIKKDFPLTKDALFAELQRAVRGISEAEYERWLVEGRFDSRVIDGVVRFMASSTGNLFWRYPELSNRRLPLKNTAALERRVLESCDLIASAAAKQGAPYVLPKEFETTMTLTVKPGVTREGEQVRAWLPIPREYPFQREFNLLSSSPAGAEISDLRSPIRSVYLTQTARADWPARFSISYTFQSYAVRFAMNPERVTVDALEGRPELRKYLVEAPHVQFTPEMRQLSAEIAGAETNAYFKAKKFYDWIAQNIRYSYAIEYSTIRDIGGYCRRRGYGDCGQEALLFITLCRMNKIPARWQSGWNLFPGAKSIHDWAEIYMEPYGWVPVDPYMGIFAMRYCSSLSADERLRVRDFYFGGLDQYRMIANSDHCQELSPPKQSMRSDTVDFQRGELESAGRNIYFDQFSYDLTAKELKPPQRRME